MIIESLLDTDLYKLSQLQAIMHQHPSAQTTYEFKCRGAKPFFSRDLTISPDEFMLLLNKELDNLASLRFTEDELAYLSEIRFFKSDFIDFLRVYQLQRQHINCKYSKEDNNLLIEIQASWPFAMYWEVPVLAIVSELYHEFSNHYLVMKEGNERLQEMVTYLNEHDKHTGFKAGFKFADFGTRRRFSRRWQEHVIETFASTVPHHFFGTSNVYFAKKYGLRPIGTMAHEWIMAHQQLGVRLVDSQKDALDCWVREYRGDLGIALSDTVGFDAFLRDFDLFFAKLYDGCRHDSGDPEEWCEKLIAHYTKLGIDPKTKSAVFSDGLNLKKAFSLWWKLGDRIKVSFGIGTDLTNNLSPDAEPLQIVIKMTSCNGKPVAKVSDSSGKGMCKDPGFEDYLRSVFHISPRSGIAMIKEMIGE